MMKLSGIFLGLIMLSGFGFLFHGCYWSSSEVIYPPVALCDTLDVSYTMDVLPILSSNCFECHSSQNASEFGNGILLEGHENTSSLAPYIVGAIQHSEGFVPMPLDKPMLDSCDIQKITAWVNQGSKDN